MKTYERPNKQPTLALVIPCYNESAVLPKTAPIFREVLHSLLDDGKVSDASFVLFVNDGSTDDTWDLILRFNADDRIYQGVCLSRNRGHQNALLAGLMEARTRADVVVSADCDGQDDIAAIGQMIDAYRDGNEVVYGCRSSRKTDTWFKRTSAIFYYRLLSWLGGEIIFNHADYRLASSRVIDNLAEFQEVNLFLRGIFPMIGFKSTKIFYKRCERLAGESHYPLLKMTAFALDGITSLSIRPIRFITILGGFLFAAALSLSFWAIISYVRGSVVPGWTSSVLCAGILGGMQLLSIGVIGEYVGKIYLEAKHRPRYIISETTQF